MRTLIFIMQSVIHLYHASLCGTMAETTSMQGQCGHKREGNDEPGHSSIDSETFS